VRATSRIAPLVKGALYLASGLWPLVHYRSFERATAPRAPAPLVKTFGAVVSLLGASLIVGALSRSSRGMARPLGAGTNLALAAVDTLYASRTRVRPAALVQTLGQLAMLGAWLAKERRDHGSRKDQ
jgi:hypothetical protein